MVFLLSVLQMSIPLKVNQRRRKESWRKSRRSYLGAIRMKRRRRITRMHGTWKESFSITFSKKPFAYCACIFVLA